jgi:predicted amidohydrolase
MPPEWAPHERTLMAWPARRSLWGKAFDRAKADYAETANTIAEFEPVTMVVQPGAADEARRALTETIDVVELPIDDSWLRDSGPIFLLGRDGSRAASVFEFNAWGERFDPYDADAEVARKLCEQLAVPAYDAGMVLEGGSVIVDGAGTALTTEQCLLNPNRNPDLGKDEIEARLRDFLGVDRIVWLGQGLVEDRDTDGHIDLIAAFTGPGKVLLQMVEEANPNYVACCGQRAAPRGCGSRGHDPRLAALRPGGRRGDRRVVHEPLHLQRRRDRPDDREPVGRAGDRAHRRGLPRPRGRRGPRGRPRLRRRWAALHHPAGAGGGRCLTRSSSPRSATRRRRSARTREADRAPLRLGLVQERWREDPDEHVAALGRGIAMAAEQGAQVVCLQELTLSPYFAITPDGPAAAGAEPEELPGGPTFAFASEAARANGVHVHASLFERPSPATTATTTAWATTPRSSSRPTARSPLARASCTSRSPRATTRTSTSGPARGRRRLPGRPVGEAKFGFPTCWDQWFPELARAYSIAGAEVIVYPTAIGSEPDHPDFDTEPLWEQVIVANGIQNGTFMVAVNRSGPRSR